MPFRIKGIEIRQFNIYECNSESKINRKEEGNIILDEIIIKNINKDNIDNIVDIVSERGYRTYTIFREYCQSGEQGYFVYYKNRIIGCGWVFKNNQNRKIKMKYITLYPNKVWLHDFWTHPQFRGNGIYTHLLRFICEKLIKSNIVKNYGDIIIDTDVSNIASNKGIAKAGFILIGNLKTFRLYKKWFTLKGNYENKV